MRYRGAGRLLAGALLLPVLGAEAADPTRELRRAQQALADGEYDRAHALFLEHADDNPLAQFTLGLFSQLGWGRPVDPGAACAWFERSAQGGIPAAASFHARCLDQGIAGEADPEAAARWLEKAAELGHAASLCTLGEMHMAGRGVARDPARAVELCRQAGAEGIASALLTVGEFHLSGDAAVHDPAAAFDAFREAAAAGAVEGFWRLDRMAEAGLAPPGVDQATRQGWRLEAASRGFAPAYLATGEGFWRRRGEGPDALPSPENLARAYLWISTAARAAADPAERRRAKAMLKEVRAVMPSTWAADLDPKVEAHLERFPPRAP